MTGTDASTPGDELVLPPWLEALREHAGGTDECGDEVDHWHAHSARHTPPADAPSRLLRWEQSTGSVRVRPERGFSDPDELGRWVFRWLRITTQDEYRIVVLTLGVGEDSENPDLVNFDGRDPGYEQRFVTSLADLAKTSDWVQFDVLFNPILNRPNQVIRLTAVPRDRTDCFRFACVVAEEGEAQRDTENPA